VNADFSSPRHYVPFAGLSSVFGRSAACSPLSRADPLPLPGYPPLPPAPPPPGRPGAIGSGQRSFPSFCRSPGFLGSSSSLLSSFAAKLQRNRLRANPRATRDNVQLSVKSDCVLEASEVVVEYLRRRARDLQRIGGTQGKGLCPGLEAFLFGFRLALDDIVSDQLDRGLRGEGADGLRTTTGYIVRKFTFLNSRHFFAF
jgi:hypothetical protein